jgi:hypothetical protein
MDRNTRLLPLGLQRLRVLDCLGVNGRFSPVRFDPDAGADLFKAFGAFIAQMSQELAADPYPVTISLLAAGRLLTGDLTAADVILDHLPGTAVKLDHGAGICLAAPLYALSAALPLPAELKNTSRWLAGSAEQAALRAWLTKYRDRLRWLEAEGLYLPSAIGRQAQTAQPPARAGTRVRCIMMTCERTLPGHSNSDLIFVDGAPRIVVEWNVLSKGKCSGVVIPLDPRFLHKIDWEDAEYVYELPVKDPRRFDNSPSIWRWLKW